MSSAFEYVSSVTYGKSNMMRDTENDELAEKGYDPFLTNRTLSYHMDTLAHANEMNRFSHLDKKLQYEFLLNSVRPRKRFGKWVKPEKVAKVEIVQNYFNYSKRKAEAVVDLLTDDDFENIKKNTFIGGR
jgi:hypothetical protein